MACVQARLRRAQHRWHAAAAAQAHAHARAAERLARVRHAADASRRERVAAAALSLLRKGAQLARRHLVLRQRLGVRAVRAWRHCVELMEKQRRTRMQRLLLRRRRAVRARVLARWVEG